jgi:hypothetical protein
LRSHASERGLTLEIERRTQPLDHKVLSLPACLSDLANTLAYRLAPTPSVEARPILPARRQSAT